MTREERIKLLKAWRDCIIRETSGMDEMCNNGRCVDCLLNYEQGTMGEQKEALDMTIKVLEQTRWIPVSERLPKDTEPVLMTVRRMGRLYNHNPFITIGHISWDKTTWWCAHDGDCVINEIEVIAWMPFLPRPFEPQESEEK